VSNPPKISLTRLRNTWAAERLAAGVPPHTVREYGRYLSYSFLLTYGDYVPGAADMDVESVLASAQMLAAEDVL
jgi:hypothetical protein